MAGLTMLGLAYFSRPVLFRRKEVLTSFFLGIFGYGLASLLLVIGIGYAGAVTAAIIAALVPVISALLDVIDSKDDRFPSFYCCHPLSGWGIDCNIE